MQARKKILFVITKSNWGGAQRYVFELATNLPKNQFDVAIALGGTGEKGAAAGALDERLRQAGVRTVKVHSFTRDVSPSMDAGALCELVALFKKERPDIVHLNSSKAGGVGAIAARLARVPRIVFTSHGLAWREDRGSFARLLIFAASYATFLLCHRVIVLCEDDRARVRALFGCGRKTALIYNGLPSLSFKPREEARAFLAARAKNSPNNETLFIGAIAELTKNKGLGFLVRACALLAARGISFELYVIGSGEEQGALQALIAEERLESRAHLLGFIQDAHRYLKAFDIFVLPSVKEGLPYVLMEAGLAAAATVASDIPGNTDIVGDSGMLFPPKNTEALAQCLEELAREKSNRLAFGEAFKRRVAERFSIEKTVDETKELYEEMAAKGGRGA